MCPPTRKFLFYHAALNVLTGKAYAFLISDITVQSVSPMSIISKKVYLEERTKGQRYKVSRVVLRKIIVLSWPT